MAEQSEVRETPNPYGEQDEWGNSISQLRANLKLTPLERLRRAEQHARELQKLKGLLHRRK